MLTVLVLVLLVKRRRVPAVLSLGRRVALLQRGPSLRQRHVYGGTCPHILAPLKGRRRCTRNPCPRRRDLSVASSVREPPAVVRVDGLLVRPPRPVLPPALGRVVRDVGLATKTPVPAHGLLHTAKTVTDTLSFTLPPYRPPSRPRGRPPEARWVKVREPPGVEEALRVTGVNERRALRPPPPQVRSIFSDLGPSKIAWKSGSKGAELPRKWQRDVWSTGKGG